MSWFWFWWLITLLMIVVDGAWWVVAMRLTKRRLWWVLVSVFIGAQLAAHLSACGQEIDFPPPTLTWSATTLSRSHGRGNNFVGVFSG